VQNLKEVDLSSNQLSSLPSNVFNVSLNLAKLSLQNNSLTAIAPDIFSGLTNLKFLNLSQNAISSHHLSRETFSSLASLKTLDLSYNQLSKLGDDILHSLTSLQTLFLHNNLIHKIDGNAFANQVQLKAIDLSRNKMSKIEIQLFASLGNLVSLKMEENELKELNNLTVKCNNVLDLTFRSNLLSSVPSFIKNCHSLQFADLSNNRISEIQNETFSELVYLIDLDLSGNQLIRLENQTFWSTSVSNSSSNLQNLKLSNNRLASIDQAAFGGLESLKVLNLNENYLDDLNGIFSHLSNLEFLNVSSNKVEWFDFAFLPNSLTWFDISNNLVVDLSNFYSLTNFRLRFLEASNNLVARVGPDSFPESLVHVRLGNNRISELDPNSFANLDNLKSVDLRMNKIEHLASDALTTSYKNVHG
jgi:Leucine-rich repeat (LRR) protein